MRTIFQMLDEIWEEERRLREDIESMKPHYPNIPDDRFQSLIELDPTYRKGSNKAGNYSKWILGLANRNNGDIDNSFLKSQISYQFGATNWAINFFYL